MPGSPFDPDALFGASPDNSSIDSFEVESNETSEATTVRAEEDTSSLMVSIVLFVSAIVVSRIGKVNLNAKKNISSYFVLHLFVCPL